MATHCTSRNAIDATSGSAAARVLAPGLVASTIIAAWKPPVAGLKNDTARLGRPSAFAESSASLGSTLASMAQAAQFQRAWVGYEGMEGI